MTIHRGFDILSLSICSEHTLQSEKNYRENYISLCFQAVSGFPAFLNIRTNEAFCILSISAATGQLLWHCRTASECLWYELWGERVCRTEWLQLTSQETFLLLYLPKCCLGTFLLVLNRTIYCGKNTSKKKTIKIKTS